MLSFLKMCVLIAVILVCKNCVGANGAAVTMLRCRKLYDVVVMGRNIFNASAGAAVMVKILAYS